MNRFLRFSILGAWSVLVSAAWAGADVSNDIPSLGWTVVLDGANRSRTNIGIPGRMDHMAYDPKSHRLFVAALENGSLEVIDVRKGRSVGSISGLEEAQGVAWIPEQSSVVVACGGDGKIHVFDTRSLRELHVVSAGDDADNVRYDARTHRLFVAVGDVASGALVEFDTSNWARVRALPFDSHPESFQLDPDGDRIYVNVPGGVKSLRDGAVAIASRRTGSVTAVIPLVGRGRNFPMALDSKRKRLFVATRRPARLIEIDLGTRTVRSETECSDDSDDMFYDEAKNRVFISSGGFRPDLQVPEESSRFSPPGSPGSLDVFKVGTIPPARQSSTPTAWHARTCLFVPSLRTVFVAVPFQGGRVPEVRQYRLNIN